MRRGLIALAAGACVGLGSATSAMAADTLVSSGDATSITATTADLNGVVYRERAGARWLFEYSTSPSFDGSMFSTTPVAIPGRLTAVERQVSGLAPGTTYHWRVVLVVRDGTRTTQSFGATETLQTPTS